MLFYLQSLVLLVARRAAGDTLEDRTPASLPFSAADRGARGAGLGDLVDSMIEGRVVLEKIKVLESRIKYQIEKLVRITDDGSKNVADGESYWPPRMMFADNAVFYKIPWPSDPTLKTWPTMMDPRMLRRTRMTIRRQTVAMAFTNPLSWLQCPTQKPPATSVPNGNPSPKRCPRSFTKIHRDRISSLPLAWARCRRWPQTVRVRFNE